MEKELDLRSSIRSVIDDYREGLLLGGVLEPIRERILKRNDASNLRQEDEDVRHRAMQLRTSLANKNSLAHIEDAGFSEVSNKVPKRVANAKPRPRRRCSPFSVGSSSRHERSPSLEHDDERSSLSASARTAPRIHSLSTPVSLSLAQRHKDDNKRTEKKTEINVGGGQQVVLSLDNLSASPKDIKELLAHLRREQALKTHIATMGGSRSDADPGKSLTSHGPAGSRSGSPDPHVTSGTGHTNDEPTQEEEKRKYYDSIHCRKISSSSARDVSEEIEAGGGHGAQADVIKRMPVHPGSYRYNLESSTRNPRQGDLSSIVDPSASRDGERKFSPKLDLGWNTRMREDVFEPSPRRVSSHHEGHFSARSSQASSSGAGQKSVCEDHQRQRQHAVPESGRSSRFEGFREEDIHNNTQSVCSNVNNKSPSGNESRLNSNHGSSHNMHESIQKGSQTIHRCNDDTVLYRSEQDSMAYESRLNLASTRALSSSSSTDPRSNNNNPHRLKKTESAFAIEQSSQAEQSSPRSSHASHQGRPTHLSGTYKRKTNDEEVLLKKEQVFLSAANNGENLQLNKGATRARSCGARSSSKNGPSLSTPMLLVEMVERVSSPSRKRSRSSLEKVPAARIVCPEQCDKIVPRSPMPCPPSFMVPDAMAQFCAGPVRLKRFEQTMKPSDRHQCCTNDGASSTTGPVTSADPNTRTPSSVSSMGGPSPWCCSKTGDAHAHAHALPSSVGAKQQSTYNSSTPGSTPKGQTTHLRSSCGGPSALGHRLGEHEGGHHQKCPGHHLGDHVLTLESIEVGSEAIYAPTTLEEGEESRSEPVYHSSVPASRRFLAEPSNSAPCSGAASRGHSSYHMASFPSDTPSVPSFPQSAMAPTTITTRVVHPKGGDTDTGARGSQSSFPSLHSPMPPAPQSPSMNLTSFNNTGDGLAQSPPPINLMVVQATHNTDGLGQAPMMPQAGGNLYHGNSTTSGGRVPSTPPRSRVRSPAPTRSGGVPLASSSSSSYEHMNGRSGTPSRMCVRNPRELGSVHVHHHQASSIPTTAPLHPAHSLKIIPFSNKCTPMPFSTTNSFPSHAMEESNNTNTTRAEKTSSSNGERRRTNEQQRHISVTYNTHPQNTNMCVGASRLHPDSHFTTTRQTDEECFMDPRIHPPPQDSVTHSTRRGCGDERGDDRGHHDHEGGIIKGNDNSAVPPSRGVDDVFMCGRNIYSNENKTYKGILPTHPHAAVQSLGEHDEAIIQECKKIQRALRCEGLITEEICALTTDEQSAGGLRTTPTTSYVGGIPPINRSSSWQGISSQGNGQQRDNVSPLPRSLSSHNNEAGREQNSNKIEPLLCERRDDGLNQGFSTGLDSGEPHQSRSMSRVSGSPSNTNNSNKMSPSQCHTSNTSNITNITNTVNNNKMSTSQCHTPASSSNDESDKMSANQCHSVLSTLNQRIALPEAPYYTQRVFDDPALPPPPSASGGHTQTPTGSGRRSLSHDQRRSLSQSACALVEEAARIAEEVRVVPTMT